MKAGVSCAGAGLLPAPIGIVTSAATGRALICPLAPLSFDYDNLWPYLRDLYQTPRVASTVNFDHFIRGYNLNLPQLNPAGIIPIGPDLDFWEPHGRESLGG